MPWFEERYHPRWRQRVHVERVLHREQTPFQAIEVLQSLDLGRILVLDGVLQATEADEFVYHEMMAHVPLMAHGAAADVLIIGGGDGGTLEEVLKHNCVRRAVLVELDRRVVEVSRAFLPAIAGSAFDDPRTELRFEDGVAFVAGTANTFDVVIVDSTDPVGPGEALFGEAFYADCRRRLRPGGILVNQCGNAFGEEATLWHTVHRLRRHFPIADFYVSAPPTYFGGLFNHGFATDAPAARALDAATLEARGVPPDLGYYAPAVHVAAFAHPPWLERVLARPEPPPASFTIGA